jgi:hypothetical protein
VGCVGAGRRAITEVLVGRRPAIARARASSTDAADRFHEETCWRRLVEDPGSAYGDRACSRRSRVAPPQPWDQALGRTFSVVRGQSPLVACYRLTVGARRARVIPLFVDREHVADQTAEDTLHQAVLGRQIEPASAARAAEWRCAPEARRCPSRCGQVCTRAAAGNDCSQAHTISGTVPAAA